MFITINQKNIIKFLYVLSFFFILSFILTFILNFVNVSNISPKNNTNELELEQKNSGTTNLAFTNKTIILDAGHGMPDGGATSNDGKILESTINLNIVFKLQKLLTNSNINVILTRTDENGIYSPNCSTIREKKISDLKNRVKISNESNADLFISIHMNKLQDKSVKGFQVFYSTTYPTSKKFAQNIQEILNNSITEFENTKKIKQIPDIYLSKHLNLPFILIECGFLSNEFETNLLTNEEYQDKLAYGIYKGILNSLE